MRLPRHFKVNWFWYIIGVVAMVLIVQSNVSAYQSKQRANEVQRDLREEVLGRTADNKRRLDDNALSSYLACVNSNRNLRPAVREVTSLLRTLLVTSLKTAPPGSNIPKVFLDAPDELKQIIKVKLASRNCQVAYADGYKVAIARGRTGRG